MSFVTGLQCRECGQNYPQEPLHVCETCFGPLEIQYGQLFAIVLILSLGWLNYYGVKVGGNVQVAVTFLKVALIAAIILAGLLLGHPHAPEAASVAPLLLRLARKTPTLMALLLSR